jgi:squalene-hopene/tetraprenyl-beta-curcumene cyclase
MVEFIRFSRGSHSFGFSPAGRNGVLVNEQPADLKLAIDRTCSYLLARQHPDGYWAGSLEADASVTAGYIPLMHAMLGQVDPQRQRQAVNNLLTRQQPDGSWPAYTGGPGDLNVSIQCYFSLKLAGLPAADPHLAAARAFIREHGGLQQANLFTKIWLACFGQYDWEKIPSLPPEIIFFPNWFVFNIYEFASWSRATIMALCALQTLKPRFGLPENAGVQELAVRTSAPVGPPAPRPGDGWRRFFLVADRLFRLWGRLPWQPGRRTALRRVEAWIVEHQETDGSWGGILLPWVYSLFALKALGYPNDHPVIARGLAGFEGFMIDQGDSLLLQPSTSPVWDTAWTVLALNAAGLPGDHPALQQAARWLMNMEIRLRGDWKIKNPRTGAGGWSFEFRNEWYPDLDDSAVVPRALSVVKLDSAGEAAKAQAIQRAARWVVEMQSKDGGWAAFDRDNSRKFLDYIPFADFMSPLDPTCADVTAHVLEFLKMHENEPAFSKALQRGLAYLQKIQENDGAWFGRWGVNYIYGTGLAMAGLRNAGLPADHPALQRGAAWLASTQHPDGGWGESGRTYDDPGARGRGLSSASQTAWALLGLHAALSGMGGAETGDRETVRGAARRGLDYLLETQQIDGSWTEAQFTGTGFPRLFYLRYDLYRIYFPLLSLARFCQDQQALATHKP